MMTFYNLEFVQALVLKEFPALSITLFFQSLFGTILSTIFTLIMVTDPSAWKLRPDIGLFAIVYSVSICQPSNLIPKAIEFETGGHHLLNTLKV